MQRFVMIFGLWSCLLTASLCVAQQSSAGTLDPLALELRLVDAQGQPLNETRIFRVDGSLLGTSGRRGELVLAKAELPDTVLIDVFAGQHVALSSADAYPSKVSAASAEASAMDVLTLTVPVGAAALAEAVVVGRRNDRAGTLPWHIATIDARDIAIRQPETAASVLEQSGEVFVQRSQYGGGSPVLRGFEANRVLLVVDGVRLNNAIYREGHLQSAITIDPNILERAEVIFGPGSLHYGSDAIGGVVHYRTREPQFISASHDKVQGRAFVRTSSASRQLSAHAELGMSGMRWATLTSITAAHFGDLRAGEKVSQRWGEAAKVPFYLQPGSPRDTVLANPDPAVQRRSGYQQLDLTQKVRFAPSSTRTFGLNLQLSTSSNVPRFDNLVLYENGDPRSLTYAEWYYGPQRRLLAALTSTNWRKNRFHDRAQWIASWQRSDEDRYERSSDSRWRDFSLVDVTVFGLTYDADKSFGLADQFRLSYGIDGQHNEVASLGGRRNVDDDQVLYDRLSRYPSGGATQTMAGAYSTLNLRSRDARWQALVGLRYSVVRLSAVFGKPGIQEPVEWPEALRAGITGINDAWTGTAGLIYRPRAGTQVQGLVSTAFRSPNVDDFGKTRVRGRFVLVPNPALAPETSLNAELTITQAWRTLDGPGFAARLSATAYATDLRGAVVRAAGQLPNGDTSFVSDGRRYRVQNNVNADRTEVRGAGLRVDVSQGSGLRIGLRVSYATGTSFAADGKRTPLAHVPPLFGQVLARYRLGPLDLTAVWRLNGRKRWDEFAPEGSSDNREYAVADYGSPAWSVLDLQSTWRLSPKLDLQAGVENIADLYYRSFSSGIAGGGRNFILALRARF